METHLYTIEFFFLSQEFSYEHPQRFLTSTIFLYAMLVLVFLE